jgi:hypothetical protein
MRIVSSVELLADQGMRRIDRLKQVLDSGLTGTADPRLVVAHTTIELASLWVAFNRFYFLSIALGAGDSAGNRLPAARRFATANDALRAAYAATQTGTPPPVINWTKEPKWWDVSKVDACLLRIGSPSVGKVRAAVSVPSDVFDALQPYRNFYAHRNEDTVAKARRAYGGTGAGSQHPTDMLLATRPSRPQCVLADWVDTIRIVLSLMA